MKVILETHTLIWAVDQPHKLSPTAVKTIHAATQRFLSIASVWEISIKVALGKSALSAPFRPWINKALYDVFASILPISIDHADQPSRLPYHHNDPFDRMIIAQSLFEGMPVIGSDAIFDAYGVVRIW